MQHPGEDDIKYGTLILKVSLIGTCLALYKQLSFQIRTDDQLAAGKGPSRDKDTKGLSGGEKSFSTLCLLMSLWDVGGSTLSHSLLSRLTYPLEGDRMPDSMS